MDATGRATAAVRQRRARLAQLLGALAPPSAAAVSDAAAAAAAAAGLQEDFELFVRALKELHPGMGRYTPLEDMETMFASARRQLDGGEVTDLVGFEALLGAIISKIGCGHTRVRVDEAEQQRRMRELQCLPLSVRFIDERAYVLRDHSGSGVPAGSELITLDGRSLASVADDLLLTIQADGFIRTGAETAVSALLSN